MLEHGYAVAIRDTLGRFASEGIWYPLLDDLWGQNRDGYDSRCMVLDAAPSMKSGKAIIWARSATIAKRSAALMRGFGKTFTAPCFTSFVSCIITSQPV